MVHRAPDDNVTLRMAKPIYRVKLQFVNDFSHYSGSIVSLIFCLPIKSGAYMQLQFADQTTISMGTYSLQ